MKQHILLHKNSSRIAVNENDIYLTYRELFEIAQSVVKDINDVVTTRAHVAILLPNSIDYVVSYTSLIISDHVIVPIYNNATVEEIVNTVEFCDVSLVITNKTGVDKLLETNPRHMVFVYDISTRNLRIIGDIRRVPDIHSLKDTFVMIGTSGSTSKSKRVMLSNSNILSNVDSIVKSLGYGKSEKMLSMLPLSFASANTSQLCVSLVLGSSLYIYTGAYYPKLVYEAMKKYEITSTTLVPTLVKTLLSDNTFVDNELPNLRKICFGGATTDTVTYSRMMESKLKDKFVHLYGQTETSPRIAHLHFENESYKIPSVGKPLDGVEVCTLREDPDSKEGELLVRGPNVMQGYYKSDIEITSNGWLATGDIGYIDDDGYIFITGRKKNIIIYSGMNIYAEEVEEIICNHSSVKEAIVVGMTSSQYGEIPVAKVVLKAGFQTTESELRQFCARKLSQYKVPTKITFVDELPKTQNGKILHKKETSHE